MFDILKELEEANKIAIGGHARPDGDCVGSCMGMYLFLRRVYPDKKVDVFLERPAAIFNCIASIDKIKQPDGTKKDYDVFIAIDCNEERLVDAQPIYSGAKKTINIDHHISNQGESDVNYIIPDASSASELVYDCIKWAIELKKAASDIIDVDIATAIYIGIIHDTGIMQYSNTSPKTLRVLAELIEYGFDFPKLIDETFHEKTYLQNQIMGRALLESILIMDKKVIVSHIDQKTMRFYGATAKDMDGIVSQLRYTKGVNCSIFMYEIENMKYKVSLRSDGVIDCSVVCSYFGGGGHVRAAGCTLEGTYYDVINNLSAQIALQNVY